MNSNPVNVMAINSAGELPDCSVNRATIQTKYKHSPTASLAAGMSEEKFTVYPNPANGVYNVQIDKKYNLDELSIRVIDNISRVIYEEVPSDYTQKISISDASGIYYLELSNKNQIVGRAKLIAYE